MQEVKIDATQIPEVQMRRLCEGAYRLLVKLQSTAEGRKMLREETKLYRQEQAERRRAKC